LEPAAPAVDGDCPKRVRNPLARRPMNRYNVLPCSESHFPNPSSKKTMKDQSAVRQTREKIELVTKIGIALVAIFLVAPFIFVLVKGLIGLAAAVTIAGVFIALAPAASLVIANLGVSMLKFEAARNPVETLQNEYREKAQQLEEKKEAIETGTAKFKTFESKVASLKKRFPDEAQQFESQLNGMRDLIEIRKEKYKAAAQELAGFQEIVGKADAIWQVSQALNDMTTGQDATDEFYSELRTKTALDSVQESLGRSFAALDTSLLEEEVEKKALAGQQLLKE
jgi:hypothetical protein